MERGQASMKLTALPWADPCPCKWNMLRARMCSRSLVSPCSVKTSLSPAWGLQLSSEGRCQQAIWKSVCGHSPLSKYDCSFHCLQFMFKGKSWALLSYVLAEGTLSLVGGIRQWSRQGLAGREATGMACPGLQVLVHSGMSKGPHCTSARPWSCPSANL